MSWWNLLSAALAGGMAGGVVVKVIDIGYQEFRGRSERELGARRFVDENLDPVLKAADELAAKLGALAKSDFRPLRAGYRSHMDNHDFSGLLLCWPTSGLVLNGFVVRDFLCRSLKMIVARHL